MKVVGPSTREILNARPVPHLPTVVIVMSSPKGPYRLVTVNTAPERAKRLVGRVVVELKDQYTIEHIANCESKSCTLNRRVDFTTYIIS